VTEWALQEGRSNVNRDRMEYVRANKGVLIQEIIPLYLHRSGFPRHFEDASPCMLQYASGDPDYVRSVDKGTRFESTENLVRDRDMARLYGDTPTPRPTGMGVQANEMWKYRINYRENFLSLRWDHDNIEPAIDLGAEGQTLMKQVLWMEYFFRGSHHGGKYLGNDPEEGFRGAMLNLMAVSKMLMLKGSLLYDGERLGGRDPRDFKAGSAWFPHRVGVRLRYVGDLPPRPEEFSVEDGSSRLFDQASLLWGLSEFYHFADPTTGNKNWHKVFGEDPRYDGTIMERKYVVLAEALASMVLQNIAAMHRGKGGAPVSEWLPGAGPGREIATADLGMAMVALANSARHLPADSEDARLSRKLMGEQADFLVANLQAQDGSIADGYDLSARQPLEGPPSLLAQGFGVRGLVEAFKVLGDDRYRKAALDAYAYMNRSLWDESTGVYRSHAGAGVTVYTPLNLGAALGAVREIILLTKDAREIERFKRFWVQAVDSSGIQQSEYEETGERDFAVRDGDGDGIPRMEFARGKHGHGIAPVYAARVEIRTPIPGAGAR
ncbi:MAG: hypothetical protein HY720_08645, partial [Planctomycetes bacterium]|nr:hypothetical protein [Planctomycetota bacterium]